MTVLLPLLFSTYKQERQGGLDLKLSNVLSMDASGHRAVLQIQPGNQGKLRKSAKTRRHSHTNPAKATSTHIPTAPTQHRGVFIAT